MGGHEIKCFADALRCDHYQLSVTDLLTKPPSRADLDAADVVLLGGSGDYSVAHGGPWLPAALDSMRGLHDQGKPTFASCWGFQAMAAAMGGEVVCDLDRAEVGTHVVSLTEAGSLDPVFGAIGPSFRVQLGHEDIVDSLPEDAVRLASTTLVANQAFRFEGLPIYCTQFHPELRRDHLLDRLRTYPKYVEKIAGIPYEVFVDRCYDTPESATLLERYVRHVFGD